MLEGNPKQFTESECEELRRQACWVESAAEGHRNGVFTILDCKLSWAVYKSGMYLNTVSWEGRFGTPKNVPCVAKETYLGNVSQLNLLGIEIVSESQLRGDGLVLNLGQMLELMVLNGNRLQLPSEVHFEMRSYQALKKSLVNAGATYQDSGFAFDSSATAEETLSRLLGGERINIKKSLQYFPTTDSACDELLYGLDLANKIVFEPSAGEGYLVRRAFQAGAAKVLVAEIYEKFHNSLIQSGAKIIGKSIFDVQPGDVSSIDVVIMNPPWSGAQDVRHIEHVLDTVPESVVVHAIMSQSVIESTNQVYERFRSFLNLYGVEPVPMKAGTFRESGTMAKGCVVRIPPRNSARRAA